MNIKSKIIITIILVLGLMIAGLFYYNKIKEDKMGPVSFDSFKRTESGGMVLMESKDVGLKFAVPDGWEILSTDIASISMHSPDFIPFQEPSFIPSAGCWIDVTPKIQVEGSDYDLEYTHYKQVIDDKDALEAMNSENERCEIGILDGLKSIKDDYFNNDGNNQGNFISLIIPYNNVVYHFETYIFGKDKEKCSQEFDNFLTTISIKKK